MLNNLIPFLPAIALLAAMLIGFGARHYLDLRDLETKRNKRS